MVRSRKASPRSAVSAGKPVDVEGLIASLKSPAESSPAAPSEPVAGPSTLAPPDEPPVRLVGLPPDEPTLPGFAMSDDLDELPGVPAPQGQEPGEASPPQPPSTGVARPIDVPDEDFVPLGDKVRFRKPDDFAAGLRTGVRYESRIRVLEAYQYPGNLKTAPAWVDRNWTGYASDYDPLRGLEPGPALRVPTRHGDTVVLCRPGDYVVRQEVVLMHGVEPDVVTEVWAKESFEKNFIPEYAGHARPGAGTLPADAAE